MAYIDHAAEIVRVMRTARLVGCQPGYMHEMKRTDMCGTESLTMARKEMASSQNWREIQVMSSRRRFWRLSGGGGVSRTGWEKKDGTDICEGNSRVWMHWSVRRSDWDGVLISTESTWGIMERPASHPWRKRTP